MAETRDFDLVVVGGGPTGASGAVAAGVLGKRVALVEREADLGGAGINTGTMPSKTLRETALALTAVRARQLYGVDLSLRREATIADFMHHERRVTASERSRLEERLRHFGVERVHGAARFVDPHTLDIGGDVRLRGERVLIATGSSPARPPEFCFDDPRVHDSNEILALEALPHTLAVVGAGVIGAEYASTFAALGCTVHLIDGRDTLLPFLDADVSRALEAAMAKQGVHFHWRERVVRCDAGVPGVLTLMLSSDASIAADGVLVAAGRVSNTADLGLDAAGLVAGDRGLLKVNESYQTAVPHIYAAGDVIGSPALASTGMEQARLAMRHAFAVADTPAFPRILPTGIYTIPEVSAVGETEASLARQGLACIVGRAGYSENARGEIIGDDTGFLKLIFARDDMRLLGVHVLGEHATELVHIGLVAMMCGAGVSLFESACFNFPTLGDLYTRAAYDALLAAGIVRSDAL